MKKILFAFAILALLADIASAQEWVQTNGPAGNGIKTIAFNKNKGMFVLSDVLLRSTDGGASWTGIGPQISESFISDIAIVPTGEVYILVYYKDFPNPPTVSQVWKSLDNGDSWSPQLKIEGVDSYSLTTSIDGDIYIAGYTLEIPNISYVYSSTNGGLSWDSTFISSTSFITGLNTDKHGNVFCLAGGLLRSVDHGKSWNRIINGLDSLSFSNFSSAPNGDDYIVGDGLYRSTDAGTTWVKILNQLSFANHPRSCLVDNRGRVFSFDTYYLTYSDDNCKSWHSFAQWYSSGNAGDPPKYAITLSPDSGFYGNSYTGRLLYACNPDSNESPWKSFSVPISHISAIICTKDGNLVASSHSNNDYASNHDFNTYWRSIDQGNIWTMLTGAFGVWTDIAPLCYTESKIGLLAGTISGVYVSIDSGESWNKLNKESVNGFSHIIIDHKGNLFASCDQGVFGSTDNGRTWNQLNNGIRIPTIFSLAVNSKDEIFAGSRDGLYKSINQGLNWQLVENDSIIFTIVIDKEDQIFAGGNRDIVRSKDNGKTWEQITIGLPRNIYSNVFTFVHDLALTPSGTIFAGTDSGVFRLDSGASAWFPFSIGLTTKNILSLTYNSEGRLFAGSDGSGVFKSYETFNVAHGLVGWIDVEDINFDSIGVGGNICKDMLIRNVGAAPFTLKGFAVIDPTPFSVDTQSIKFPITLQPNTSIKVRVCFHPPQTATYASEIDWITNLADSLSEIMKSKSILHGVADSRSDVKISQSEINFSLHPNPTYSNTITLSFPESQLHAIPISVYDVLGREVYRNVITQGLKEFDIPIRDLSEGIYYVRMSLNGSTVTEKFVKVK